MKSLILLCALLLSTLPTPAAVDMFLKLTNIPGESVAKGHEDEIEIYSYSWGVSNSSTFGSGGTTTGKAIFQNLALTKLLDKSSTALMLKAANGTHITEAILTLQKSGGDAPYVFMRITLTDVIVSNVSSSASTGGDVPVESISLNYAKIKVEYFQQKSDGTVIPAGVFTWDLIGNRTA